MRLAGTSSGPSSGSSESEDGPGVPTMPRRDPARGTQENGCAGRVNSDKVRGVCMTVARRLRAGIVTADDDRRVRRNPPVDELSIR